MKWFLVIAAFLAALIVSTWVKFVPVRCDICDGVLFRTNMASVMFGGHGDCMHATCVPEFTRWSVPSSEMLKMERLPPHILPAG